MGRAHEVKGRRATGRSPVPRGLAIVAIVAAAFALTASSCQPPPPPDGSSTTTSSSSSTTTTVVDGSSDSIEIGEDTVTVEVPTGQTVSIEAADPSGLPPVAGGFDAPLGALDITVGGLDPGGATQVVVTFERSIDLVQKLLDGTWQDFAHDGTTGATIQPGGTSVTLDLLDGGRGDTDGAADGTITDPLLPLDAQGVQITTSATPFVQSGVPYSLQLQAVGAEPDAAVTWSVLDGAVPYGMALDPSGVVEGTLPGTISVRGPVAARVQVTDGTTTDTKLLLFATLATGAGMPTGAPLPDGAGIDLAQLGPSLEATADLLRADGTFEPATQMDVPTLMRVSTAVNPAGTLMAHRWNDGVNPPSGPMLVLDADDGSTVASLPAEQASYPFQALWSPDGAHLALPDYSFNNKVDGPLYETAGWSLVRQFEQFGRGQLRWSDDGSTLFDTAGFEDTGATSTTVHTLQAPGFTTGPTISIASPNCTARAISVTDRLAVTCPVTYGTIWTMSAQDGSDVRDVFDECAPTLALPCKFQPQSVHFSPSGSHLVMSSLNVTSVSPFTADLVLATIPDLDGAASTDVLVGPGTSQPQVFRWR